MIDNGAFDVTLVSLNGIFVTNANIENKTGNTSLQNSLYTHTIKFDVSTATSKSHKDVLKILVLCNVDTKNSKGETIEVTASFEIAYFFKVENLAMLISDDGNNIDTDLVLNLTNIAYSTTRGIVYSKCQGTILHKLIIPIIPNKKLSEILSGGADV